jgi:hypothetical protein
MNPNMWRRFLLRSANPVENFEIMAKVTIYPRTILMAFCEDFPFPHCLFGKVQTIGKENIERTRIIAFYVFNDVYSVELKSFKHYTTAQLTLFGVAK